jgi:hypothetical protein
MSERSSGRPGPGENAEGAEVLSESGSSRHSDPLLEDMWIDLEAFIDMPGLPGHMSGGSSQEESDLEMMDGNLGGYPFLHPSHSVTGFPSSSSSGQHAQYHHQEHQQKQHDQNYQHRASNSSSSHRGAGGQGARGHTGATSSLVRADWNNGPEHDFFHYEPSSHDPQNYQQTRTNDSIHSYQQQPPMNTRHDQQYSLENRQLSSLSQQRRPLDQGGGGQGQIKNGNRRSGAVEGPMVVEEASFRPRAPYRPPSKQVTAIVPFQSAAPPTRPDSFQISASHHSMAAPTHTSKKTESSSQATSSSRAGVKGGKMSVIKGSGGGGVASSKKPAKHRTPAAASASIHAPRDEDDDDDDDDDDDEDISMSSKSGSKRQKQSGSPSANTEGGSSGGGRGTIRVKNREHAKNTRMRKKNFIDQLREQVEFLSDERDRIDRERRAALQAMADRFLVRKQVVQMMLLFRGEGESNFDRWRTLLDESFVMHLPITPYRSFSPSEVSKKKIQFFSTPRFD